MVGLHDLKDLSQSKQLYDSVNLPVNLIISQWQSLNWCHSSYLLSTCKVQYVLYKLCDKDLCSGPVCTLIVWKLTSGLLRQEFDCKTYWRASLKLQKKVTKEEIWRWEQWHRKWMQVRARGKSDLAMWELCKSSGNLKKKGRKWIQSRGKNERWHWKHFSKQFHTL